MTRLSAWCPKGAKMATATEYRERVVSEDGRRIDGWRCPPCSRVVKIGQSDGRNCDRGGWHGTLGPRWPRHYSWAQGMKK